MERKTILIVEDEGVCRGILTEVLANDYNLLEASCCSEAKKHISNRIDLALIDYHLPDGSGFDVLRTLRALRPDMPVILMTGYGAESLAVRALRVGITDYIKKPVNIGFLTARIAEILYGTKFEDIENASGRDEFAAESLAALLENHYSEEFTLDKLSGRVGIDKFRLSRIFKRKFGKSFVTYLNEIRTRNAAEMLMSSQLNITQIAFSVGFRSVEHFDRTFRLSYGTSPREYRRAMEANLSGTVADLHCIG